MQRNYACHVATKRVVPNQASEQFKFISTPREYGNRKKLAVKIISLCVRACILWHLPLRFREFQHLQTWPIFIHFQFVT